MQNPRGHNRDYDREMVAEERHVFLAPGDAFRIPEAGRGHGELADGFLRRNYGHGETKLEVRDIGLQSDSRAEHAALCLVIFSEERKVCV